VNLKSYIALKDDIRGIFSIGEIGGLSKTDVMLWCHDINRNHVHEGLLFSSITDSLNDRFAKMGLSTITIARPYSGIPEEECYGVVRRVNGIIARAILLDYCIKLIKKIFKAQDTRFNVNFQVMAWERILKKINPKFIIGIEPIKELCIAAKNNNIVTFDVQHGVQIDSTGEFPGHFYRMEYRELKQTGWPDFVVCWDKDSTDLLKKFRGEFTTPLTLGHPWALRFLSPNQIKDPIIKSASRAHELESDLPVILYSLQYSRDANGNTDSFVPIPKELDTFIKREGKSFTWWLRVHPQLLRDEFRKNTFEKLAQLYSCYNNVNWLEVSYAPLPYVLSKTSLHFSRDSSVVKEASYFGVKSGLFDEEPMRKRLKSLYSNLIQRGDVEVIEDYQHIREFINRESSEIKYTNNDELIIGYENTLKNILQLAHQDMPDVLSNRQQ
jgi:hypothetical protein